MNNNNSHSGSALPRYLLIGMLLGLLSPLSTAHDQLNADDYRTPERVGLTILPPKDRQDNSRIELIGREASDFQPKRICWDPKQCTNAISYTWGGRRPTDPLQRLQVVYKPGLFWIKDDRGRDQVGRVDPKDCFSGLNDDNTLELAYNTTGTIELIDPPTERACRGKVYFFYDVECVVKSRPPRMGEAVIADQKCRGVDALDPGTLIDNRFPSSWTSGAVFK